MEEQIAEVESDIEATMCQLTEHVNHHSELTERQEELEGRIESLETEHDAKKASEKRNEKKFNGL